ncbi:MAG: hypothetical protein WBM40_12845, partial [Thiohalocapsa sp.]
ARGERGALVVNLDSLFRIASNPFFPYLLARIDEGIADPAPAIPGQPIDTADRYSRPAGASDHQRARDWRLFRPVTAAC